MRSLAGAKGSRHISLPFSSTWFGVLLLPRRILLKYWAETLRQADIKCEKTNEAHFSANLEELISFQRRNWISMGFKLNICWGHHKRKARRGVEKFSICHDVKTTFQLFSRRLRWREKFWKLDVWWWQTECGETVAPVGWTLKAMLSLKHFKTIIEIDVVNLMTVWRYVARRCQTHFKPHWRSLSMTKP